MGVKKRFVCPILQDEKGRTKKSFLLLILVVFVISLVVKSPENFSETPKKECINNKNLFSVSSTDPWNKKQEKWEVKAS